MSRLYFGTYEQVLYPYVKHNLKAEDRVQNETAFVEHLLLAADEEGNTVCDITSSVASRYRTGARAIPDNVVALFRKANARSIVIDYLDDLVVPYIERGRKQALINEFVDVLEKDRTIDRDFKKALFEESTTERLAAFLADLLIYAVGIDPTAQVMEIPEENSELLIAEKVSNIGASDGLFMGRGDLLQAIENGFQNGYRSQFIGGGDGFGKTRVVLEYAQSHADEYQIICWINAWSEDCIKSSIVSFFNLAKVPCDEALPDGLSELFCRFFEANSDWLLIFDNADLKFSLQQELIKKYIPAGKGHILVTGNFGEQNIIGDGKYHLVNASIENKCIDERLFSLCDGQPLPLTLTTSYVRESSWVDTEAYLHMLEDRGIRESKNAASYIDEAAFEIKVGALHNRERYFKDKVAVATRQFLIISAILNQVDIDLLFLSSVLPVFPEPLSEVCADQERRTKLIENLNGFGFNEIRENMIHGNTWLSTLSHDYFSMEEQKRMCEFILDRIEKNIAAICENQYTRNVDAIIALTKPYTNRARYFLHR